MNAKCVNEIGSHNCTCLQGYSGDGLNCYGMFKRWPNIVIYAIGKFSSRAFRQDKKEIIALFLAAKKKSAHN